MDKNIEDIENIETLGAAYLWYVKDFDCKRKSTVGTAIFRYLLPNKRFGLNFTFNPDKRLTIKQKAQALELSYQLKLEDFSNIELVLSWQEEVFEMFNITNLNIRKGGRWHLKDFLEKCQDAGLLQRRPASTWEIPLFQETSRYHGRGARENHPVTNRKKLVNYRININQLSNETQSEILDCKNFWTEENYGSRPIQKIIDKPTWDGYVSLIRQMLGWLMLDKVAYHHNMYEYARAKKQQKSDYESDWLLIDPNPPAWIEEMNQKYPPKKAIEQTLDDLIPIVDIRAQKPG